MKKHLAVLITLVLLITSCSVAFAEDTAMKNGIFTYTVSGKNATITCVEDVDGRVDVPDELDGYTVTAIGSGAFGSSARITEVYLPDTVRTIGATCFAYSTSIKKVRLSKALTSISQGAFNQCEALFGITIPYGVKTIEGKAFAGCPNLSSVSIASTITQIADDAFEGSRGTRIYCKLSDNPRALSYATEKNIPYEKLITVYVNGKEIDFDQAPVTDKKRFRTLVPLRSVLEEMGAEIEWYTDMEYAGIDIGGHRLLVKPDESFMMVDGKTTHLSAPAIEYNNRVLLPIREVVEAVGGKVVWNEHATSITITYNMQ